MLWAPFALIENPAILRRIPFLLATVRAGFPSPADDYVEASLSPTEYLVNNKTATFFMRMQGDALVEAGILHGDILVIDRSRTPRSGDMVVATMDGEFVTRILRHNPDDTYALLAAHPRHEKIRGDHAELWGTVVGLMRKFK